MKTSTERSRELRKRKHENGEAEVRGVFAKIELHKELKEKIRGYIQKLRSGINE